jgi:hypothetical protein
LLGSSHCEDTRAGNVVVIVLIAEPVEEIEEEEGLLCERKVKRLGKVRRLRG